MFVSRSPSVQLHHHRGEMVGFFFISTRGRASSETIFKLCAYAYFLPTFTGEKARWALTRQTAPDLLRLLDSAPRPSITVSSWCSPSRHLVSLDYDPDTVPGLQTCKGLGPAAPITLQPGQGFIEFPALWASRGEAARLSPCLPLCSDRSTLTPVQLGPRCSCSVPGCLSPPVPGVIVPASALGQLLISQPWLHTLLKGLPSHLSISRPSQDTSAVSVT